MVCALRRVVYINRCATIILNANYFDTIAINHPNINNSCSVGEILVSIGIESIFWFQCLPPFVYPCVAICITSKDEKKVGWCWLMLKTYLKERECIWVGDASISIGIGLVGWFV